MLAWWEIARHNSLFRWTLIVAVLAIAFDQASKLWILHGLDLQNMTATLPDGRIRGGHVDLGPIFDLTYVENRGVSFGLFAGGWTSRVLLSLLALGVTGFVVHWAGSLTRKVAAIGAGFIVGGALGNAIDRIAYGYVVDFLDFSGLWFPWQFNIADVAINVGVACLAYDAFFVAPKAASPVVAGSGMATGDTKIGLADKDQNSAGRAPQTNLTETKEG